MKILLQKGKPSRSDILRQRNDIITILEIGYTDQFLDVIFLFVFKEGAIDFLQRNRTKKIDARMGEDGMLLTGISGEEVILKCYEKLPEK